MDWWDPDKSEECASKLYFIKLLFGKLDIWLSGRTLAKHA